VVNQVLRYKSFDAGKVIEQKDITIVYLALLMMHLQADAQQVLNPVKDPYTPFVNLLI
jgi:hypothetical protein